ncbi:Streptomycin phosphotransferase [Neorhizobium galegae bv. officinalis bv. officinalis str. HAMBI 1141]|uniref:Streptomycin phosphotransferase n=1 Tax=Neorhizobium galegae bv. officinalis bv. officinalis str. HAMBI 1141 TaxID=1028801 RepID=A0A068T611_NEOGA|nr:aminoglycoside phosphotransferase family protein [Neorhizobium galegae]CDN53486.1 Streptomycin phosphotransferase [Neorhizobium galegae bv. officinalis bv. officinalis str. HAMBI 1141]
MTEGIPFPFSFPVEWRIETARQIADTVVGTVLEVTRAGGEIDIVKILKPGALEDSLRGADFMAWRDGVGCIRLIARSDDLLLMEHAGKVTLRDHLEAHGDAEATRIAAEVLMEYHRPSDIAPPPTLMPLSRYFKSLFEKAETDRRDGIAGPFIEAAEMAETLIADQRDIKPLHGDLHHENIMLGPRGWLIIDPAGLIGDAAMDVANMFSNPLDRFDLTRSEERIASMAAVFAETLSRDVRTILRYAFAYGYLSAAWHEEDGNAKDRDAELAVAAAVHSVLQQA